VSFTQVRLPRGGWLPLIATWGAVLLALVWWLGRTPPQALREQLKTLQFWSLEACFVLVMICSLLVAREMWHLIGRRHASRMAALAALAAALTLFVAPRTHRIYYDEQIYQSIGQNLSDLRLAQMCLDGTVEYGRLECGAGEYNKQPYAYPHLLSIAYRIGGAGPGWAFALNALAMALTVAAVYLLVLLLFEDSVAALFGGLIMAMIPQQILWSATAAVEPLASLACVTALVATAYFIRSRTTTALVATGVLAAYAVQFRPESFLIVFVIGGLLVWFAPGEFKSPRLWWVGVVALALLAVHVAHLYGVRNESWGTSGPRFSLDYVAPNLRVNGWFYFADERFPVVYTVLALTGLTAAGWGAARLAIALYFALFFAIGLIFYAGSYNYGADVRYSLMTYPSLAVLGGLGAGYVTRWVGERQHALPARGLVMAALAFQFLWYVPLVRATTEEAWAARADVDFTYRVVPQLPRNAYVLTHNPGMFHLTGVNAGQMFLAADNPGRLQFLARRYPGGVFLHWNFWCNVADAAQQELCRKVAAMAPAVPWQEHREQDQRFSFSRFVLDGDLPVPHTNREVGQ
jgi:hypothetical protein